MADQKINITLAAIDKTKGAFGTITRSIGAVTSAVFSLKTAIVGVVGVGGIGLLVRNSLLATDTLSKTANKLGVTTEALSQLRYAAELSGVGIQTTDMAVQRFTRRLSEAANGTGEAKAALIELGINARELGQVPLEEQMIELSKAFGNVKSSSDQVRLAFKLFDSEGVSFVNILKQGEDGLRAMFNEATNLGVVMSSQAAKGVEEANDAFFRLQSLFGGIIDQIVAALAPALTALAEMFQVYLVKSIAEANGSIEKFGQNAAKYIVEGVAGILDVLAQAIKGFEAFINALEENRVWGKITKDAFGGMRTDLSLFAGSVEDAAARVRELGSAIGTTTASQSENADTGEKQISTIDRLRTAFENLKQSSDEIQRTFDSAVKRAFDGTTNALTDMVMGAKSAKDAFKDMARSIVADLIKMQIKSSITTPLFNSIQSFLPTSGKAIGGSVQAGQPYMVGERGAEMFIPNKQGSIVPADKMGGGGDSVTINLNVSTGVSQTVRAELNSMLPQIAEMSKAAVYEARRRGGTFAGAFGA